MKRAVVLLVMLGVIATALWYVLGASKTTHLIVNRPYFPFERETVRKENWQKWWPEPMLDSQYTIGGRPLQIDNILQNGFDASLLDDTTIKMSYRFVPSPGGQTAIDITLNTQTDLLSRLKWGKDVKRNAALWLENVKQTFESDSTLYGMNITRTMVTDSSLIYRSSVFDSTPALADVYAMISELDDYIKSQDARAVNFPMVNMYEEGSKTVVMTAIATDKKLAPTDKYFPRRMELGYILTGTIKGGRHKASEQLKQLQWYARDYERSSPASPYQLWITNRLEQPDSNQWITGLYYPIMY